MVVTEKTKGERAKVIGSRALASRFNKFDSDRKYDPFADTDPVIQDSKAGMEALLSMCNMVEINSLCGALGIVEPVTRSEQTEKACDIMSHIRQGGRGVQKRFAEVLRLFWEGLLFEYLRSVGCPLRDAEHDPRHFVTRYWRRSMLDPNMRPGFVPFYLKREVKKRDNIMQQDKDIRDIQSGLLVREEAVKEAEARVRGQHDYRFVLQYFSASRDLHRTLVANVNYLVNEVEQLRAQDDHNGESMGIMEKQFVELETKYDRVVGGLIYRGAFQKTVEGALYSIISHGHANLKAAEDMTREIIADMNIGPIIYGHSTVIDGVGEDARRLSRGTNANLASSDSECLRKRGEGEEHAEEVEPDPATRAERLLYGEKWAAPRRRKVEQASEERTNSGTHFDGISTDGDCPIKSDLGSHLELLRATHHTACTRYTNQVADLMRENVNLARDVDTAMELKDETAEKAKVWEARHRALEQRHQAVERRLQAEVTLVKEEAQEGNRRASEAKALLNEALERATPFLLELIGSFTPVDTEKIGVNLLKSMGVAADRYAHVLATKRMLEADLESRAFEAIEAERQHLVASEANEAELEDVSIKKKERGRPRSRGKASTSSAEKKKKDSSKSRSKSNNTGKQGKAANKAEKGKGGASKGSKKTDEKSKKSKAASSTGKGDSGGESSYGGKGTSSNQKPGPAKTRPSPSPTKKGASK